MLGADNNLKLPMSYFLDTHLGEHFQLGPASLVCVELHLAVTIKALEVFDFVNLDRRGWATLDTTNNAPRTQLLSTFSNGTTSIPPFGIVQAQLTQQLRPC